jgi:hypothetical protein
MAANADLQPIATPHPQRQQPRLNRQAQPCFIAPRLKSVMEEIHVLMKHALAIVSLLNNVILADMLEPRMSANPENSEPGSQSSNVWFPSPRTHCSGKPQCWAVRNYSYMNDIGMAGRLENRIMPVACRMGVESCTLQRDRTPRARGSTATPFVLVMAAPFKRFIDQF